MAAEAEAMLQNLERVKQVAEAAGIKGRIDEEMMQFQMLLGLPGDRSQIVLVRDSSAKERRVVTFFSPCQVIKKGLIGGVSKETAIQLLLANERMHFARYGLWELDRKLTIVASYDCLLDTLDPPECQNAAWSVAFAADRFEQQRGSDTF